MSLSALIFDVDGTLADTEQAGHRVAFNRAFDEEGLPWQWGEPLYSDLLKVAGGKERLRFYCRRFDPGFLARPDAEAIISRLYATKTRHYAALLRGGQVTLLPGVERLIGEARQAGLQLAVATTTHPDNVAVLLEATLGPGAFKWFDAVVAGDQVPTKKPAPDAYLAVLERLALPAADCVALEDSGIGVAAAVAAGIPTIAVPSRDSLLDDDFDSAIAVWPGLGDKHLADIRIAHPVPPTPPSDKQ